MTRTKAENATGLFLVRTWVTDGPGKARFGWASVHPCKTRYEGKTLREVVIKHNPELAREKGWIC